MSEISYKNYHRDKEYIDNEKLFRNIFLSRYDLIKPYASKGSKVLDIGCSNGVFLDIFKNHGWKTFGVEPSESGKTAAKKGHKISKKYFEKTTFPNNYFDLIIMNHTLEHVGDADLVLKKIHSILKNGGILFVDVPNAGGFGSRILKSKWPYRLPLEHRYQFTYDSLSRKMKKAGFNIRFWKSRSGVFEYRNPLGELWQSLSGFKKRFLTDLVSLPYSFVVTLLNMGDSMSFVAQKK